MPSQLHESLLLLFRNQPTLAVELIRGGLHVELPQFTEARLISADLTEVQPAEYRADMVIQLWNGDSVFAIVVEVQLSSRARKRFVWPAYVSNLRARLECPVCLLVVTPDEGVARWAAECIEMGGIHRFTPYVLGPSGIPQVVDEAEARANPELAVLSAMAHGRGSDSELSAQIALAAQMASVGLDADRSKLYFDLIISSLSEAARSALRNMDAQTYEYQSDFARQYVAQGVAQGEASGRAALVARQLTVRFGPLTDETRERVFRSPVAELDGIGERLLTARTVSEALGPDRSQV